VKIEARLKALGLVLPEPVQIPAGITVTFSWVRVHGDRAYVSGHGPLNPDGTVAAPLGRVGAEVSAEQAYTAARLATLAVLASLKRSLHDLDRITAWLMISGMINVAPGFTATQRDQRLLRFAARSLRTEGWRACPNGDRDDTTPREYAGRHRGRGGCPAEVSRVLPNARLLAFLKHFASLCCTSKANKAVARADARAGYSYSALVLRACSRVSRISRV
jgi:hypothetical protein